MEKLKTICFEKSPNGLQGTCGILVADMNGKPHIDLFEIKENEGRTLNAALVKGCQAIRDQLFPGVAMTEITWEYTNGICHSDISFTELGKTVISINLSSDNLGGRYFKRPLKSYQEALESPEGFENCLTGGHGFKGGRSTTVFPLLAKGLPDDMLYVRPPYWSPEGSQTILVDTKKFLAAWQAQEIPSTNEPAEKGFLQALWKRFASAPEKAGRGGLGYLFNSSEEACRRYLPANTAPDEPMDTGFLGYYPDRDYPISFVNGNHRTCNMSKLGSAYLVLQVEGDIEAFRKNFEWAPGASPQAKLRINPSQGRL